MNPFFANTEEFASLVKISATTDWLHLAPIVDHAEVQYLYPYLGAALVREIKEKPEREIFETARKALANLSMMTAVTALSVRLSDSGITVAKKESNTSGEGYVPAGDAKISALVKSYKARGFDYLDCLLSLLNQATEPPSKRFVNANSFVPDISVFKRSDVDIMDSLLTFIELRSYLNTTQRYDLQPILGEELYQTLLAKVNQEENLTEPETLLLEEIRRFLCAQAAASGLLRIFSQTTTESPSAPLSFGGGNYSYMATLYQRAAELSKGSIRVILTKYGKELGVPDAAEFDNSSSKIFYLG